MFMNASLDSGNLKHLAQPLKDKLVQLKLTERQFLVLERYYQLANLDNISRDQATESASIWEEAETDKKLSKALALLDKQPVNCLKNENLFADNDDLRASLSEHVPVLAEMKLKRLQGKRGEIDPNKPYVVMLCPDGSGFIQKPIPEGRISIREIEEEVCENCNARFSEHEIVIGGGATTARK